MTPDYFRPRTRYARALLMAPHSVAPRTPYDKVAMSARNARSGPRIAILGFYLESNAFAPVTTAADFHADCYLEGDDILIEAAKNAPAIPSEIPGFIKGMNATGAGQPLPTVEIGRASGREKEGK